MRRFRLHAVLTCTIALAGCSFGPRFEAQLPQVREVPVLASLAPDEALVRGRSFLAARQYGLAIELFKGASRDPALRTESLNGLAIAYDGIGRRDIAERYFEQALAARPDDERIRRNLARLYQATGQGTKHRAVLAARSPAPPEMTSAPSTPDEPQHDPAEGDGTAPVHAAVMLDRRSPLGPVLQPMLVKASLPAGTAIQPGEQASNGTPDATVACRPDRAAAPPNQASAMKIFRMNMGEVFITTELPGTTCRVEAPGERVSAEPEMSNREYLGLVAAYLERINRGVAADEIAALWRAAFWPQDLA